MNPTLTANVMPVAVTGVAAADAPEREFDGDAKLMLRVRAGDLEAFESLVDRYKRPVMNFIHRMINDSTEAEDLAQRVFVQVFRSAKRYRVSARFSTWLFTIARNICLNELRRRSRHPSESLEGLQQVPEGERECQFQDSHRPRPGDAVLRLELERTVEAAVKDLPENQRTAMLLLTREEMSYEQISDVLSCSVPATKSLIFRARETLKLRLKPYLHDGAWAAA